MNWSVHDHILLVNSEITHLSNVPPVTMAIYFMICGHYNIIAIHPKWLCNFSINLKTLLISHLEQLGDIVI